MGKSEKLKGRCSWSKGTSCMLELGLGYRIIFSAPVLLHPLPALFHEFMQCKDHPSQNGSMKMDVTVLNVEQFRSDAFASFLVRNVSSLDPPLPSRTASNAMRTRPTTTKTTALYGRSVAGASLLIMRITIAPLLTMDAS
jgi:hypothetical protein